MSFTKTVVAYFLLAVLFSPSALATRSAVRDLPSSRNGQSTGDFCDNTATPSLCLDSTFAVQGSQFTVNITDYHWGQGSEDGVLREDSTILEVSVTSQAPVHLVSLSVKKAGFSKPGFVVCQWDEFGGLQGTPHCIGAPLLQDDFGENIAFQPAPMTDPANQNVQWNFVNFDQIQTSTLISRNFAELSLDGFVSLPQDQNAYRAVAYDDNGNVLVAGALSPKDVPTASNDFVGSPKVITGTQYSDSELVARGTKTYATSDEDPDNPGAALPSPDGVPDPVPTNCDPSNPTDRFVAFRSVWYSFVPPFSGSLNVNTRSSSYDTTISLYRSNTSGTLDEVSCNDDLEDNLTSAISGSVTAGTTYYILVSESMPVVGGEIDNGGSPTLNPSTNKQIRAATPLSSDAVLHLDLASTDFTINPASGAATSQTVAAGNNADYDLSVEGLLGFAGDVSLTCSSGLPSKGASCTFSPSSATVSGNSIPVKLTISTTSRSTLAGLTLVMGLAATVVFGCLWGSAPSSRQRLNRIALVFSVCCVISALACGGGPSPPQDVSKGNPNGTPAGQYTVTVSATSGKVARTTALTLIVQ